jgi:hypothetical protein
VATQGADQQAAPTAAGVILHGPHQLEAGLLTRGVGRSPWSAGGSPRRSAPAGWCAGSAASAPCRLSWWLTGCSVLRIRRLRAWCPTCRKAPSALANDAVVAGDGLTRWPSWEPSPPGRSGRSRRPCHPRATSRGHQRYPADSHGHSEKVADRAAPLLTWGGGGSRNCMACKRSLQDDLG